MIYTVFGCGENSIGPAIAARLLQEDNSLVFIADKNQKFQIQTIEKLQALPRGNKSWALQLCKDGLDVVRRKEDLPKIFQNSNVVISALPAFLNPLIAEAVLLSNELRPVHFSGKTHWCDLGGELSSVREVLKLNQRAIACGASLIPSNGFGPGLTDINAVYILKYFPPKFGPVESIINYAGGLPAFPKPPYYKQLFNLGGLRSLYYSTALVLSKGKVRTISSLSHRADLPTEWLGSGFEAAVTSGLDALPYYLENQVLTLQEKTIRYKGADDFESHYDFVKRNKDGFVEKLTSLLNQYPVERNDFCYMRVVAVGKKSKREKIKVERELMVRSDEHWNSMQIATGFAAAHVAMLLAKGRAKFGAMPPGIAIDPKTALEAMKSDFQIHETITPL